MNEEEYQKYRYQKELARYGKEKLAEIKRKRISNMTDDERREFRAKRAAYMKEYYKRKKSLHKSVKVV